MSCLPKQLGGEERVPVFDPEVGLVIVAVSQLDRSFIPLQINRFTGALEKVLTCIAAQYTILEVPRFRSRFDIDGSHSDIDGSAEPDAKRTYAVFAHPKDEKEGMSLIAHLKFGSLGWWRAGPMRMLGAKYRKLWVGPIPESALTK